MCGISGQCVEEADVVSLASALHRPEVAGWCLDFSAAGVAGRNAGLLRHSPWIFLPANGVAFFEEMGWQTEYLESIFTAAGRFGRLPASSADALAGPQPDPRSPGQWPYSAVVHLSPN